MARTPLLLNPKFLLQNLRDGFDAAKARTGHEGGLIALSAGGLILAFFLLALLAPLALNAPGIVSYGAGAFVLLLVLASTGAGAVALWRLMAAGAREGGGGVIVLRDVRVPVGRNFEAARLRKARRRAKPVGSGVVDGAVAHKGGRGAVQRRAGRAGRGVRGGAPPARRGAAARGSSGR